jgi:hypothetical protein
MVDVPQFRVRLVEAMAWCNTRVATGAGGLWTPALQPSTLGLVQTDTIYEWGEGIARRSVVEAVADERVRLLRAFGNYPRNPADDLTDGRLLLYAPDDNLSDGAAELLSQGFFDVDNTPSWDTWVCYVFDSEQEQQVWAGYERYQPLSVLVSWVPPFVLNLAHEGTWANPEQCIAWADTVDCSFTRSLATAGLLRAP